MASLLFLVLAGISLVAVPLFGLLAWAVVREARLRVEHNARLARVPVRVDELR